MDESDGLKPDSVVEEAWRQLRVQDVSSELVAAAYAEPQLRQLFPWSGMWELHFSRCTEQRWTWDVPYISPCDSGVEYSGYYFVNGPGRGQTIGLARSVGEAIAMVVSRLPAGTGPAFHGTSDELVAHEIASGNPTPDLLPARPGGPSFACRRPSSPPDGADPPYTA